MTNEDLKRILKKWQPRCRLLKSWRVSIRFATEEELGTKDWEHIYGCVQDVDKTTREASIILRHPSRYGGMKWYPVDETVLHEMAHIIFDYHDRETGMNTFAEMMLNAYPRDKKRAMCGKPN